MHKVLYVATYGDFFSSFELINMQLWQSKGYEVHCVANFEVEQYNRYTNEIDEIGVIRHNLNFSRSPFDIKNIQLYISLKNLIKKENIDIIDSHNPIVSVMSRIAARSLKLTKVIYTAHGFFFYEGCPRKNNIIYKPVEYFLAKWTDALIVINTEDFAATKKMEIRGKSYYIPGVGVDLEAIKQNTDTCDLRNEISAPNDAFILLSVGELNSNKNHEVVIKALSDLLKQIPDANIYYCICGIGEHESYLNNLIDKLNLQSRVKLLGYRSDIPAVNRNADVFILPSLREGLGVAIIEAMVCKLPILATNIGGTRDLVDEGKGGYLFDPKSPKMITQLILKMYKSSQKRKDFGEYNSHRVDEFSIQNVEKKMKIIYEDVLSGNNGK